MTEEEIIKNIQTLDDPAEIAKRIQQIGQMRDHLNSSREDSVKQAKEWVNSSPLIFSEDFSDEMSRLDTDVSRIEKQLAELSRIEDALKQRLEELNRS